MIIDIDVSLLDGIVRAWLKDTLESLEINLAGDYLHPDDLKTYRKDIKALKRVLDYVGHI